MRGDPTNRHTPVVVQSQVSARDTVSNAIIAKWIVVKTIFVNVEPTRGRERFVASSNEQTVTHTIRGDYFDHYGISGAMRLILENRVLNIVALMPDHDGRKELMITAIETDEVPE